MNIFRSEIGRIFNCLSTEDLACPSNKERLLGFFLRQLYKFMPEFKNKQKKLVLWATKRK